MTINSVIQDTYIQRLDNIHRWAFEQTIRKESLSTHSFWVVFYTRFLLENLLNTTQKTNAEMIDRLHFKLVCSDYALLHDFREILTGDFCHEVKVVNIPGMIKTKTFLEELESHLFEERYGSNVDPYVSFLKFNSGQNSKHDTTSDNIYSDGVIYAIVKVADWMNMYCFCSREVLCGNTTFCKLMDYCKQSLRSQIQNTMISITENQKKYSFTFDLSVFSNYLND